MALTKNDLEAIRGVIKEELVPTNKRIVSLDKKVGDLDNRVVSLDKKVGDLDNRVVSLDKKIDRNFVFLKKRFDELFNFLDKSYVKVKTEVREIQTHLHLRVTDY
ncbi:MAG: Synaptonemal complex 1 [Candidatus Woesebacteria bacterium GW2011_GWA2_40_7]|uniref:Synaptonemal complex 1 n=1 Tax=Candidatus Woesebacteria bacterium GW2011_GWA2_40_7 TaxID=1618562 RepID=A0A0G0T4E7_9BACT|nr:MAG: Synaptonemal complex 1 [Candidatus Woesebacteria bacterium GW2011_GWA2_40_7]